MQGNNISWADLDETDFDNIKTRLHLSDVALHNHTHKIERIGNDLFIWWEGLGPTQEINVEFDLASKRFFNCVTDFSFLDNCASNRP